jgi:tRNA1Val (adenine37-N6)-methyltransferase
MELMEDERIDDLEYKNIKIIQNKKYFCFGIDSILLTDFAKEIKINSNCIDLGTGNGVLSILLAAKTKLNKIYGIEVQEKLADLAKRNVVLNNMEEKVEIINENINNLENIFPKKSFDYVITNPPYKKYGTGIENDNEEKLIARHEIKATLEDFINVSYNLLKDNGTMYMVHRPERLVDILYELRKRKLEPKKIKFVFANVKEKPKLVLIKAIKNANSFLEVDNPLYIYDLDGNYTKDILKIYNKI